MIGEVLAIVSKGIMLCCWVKYPFCANERRCYVRMVAKVICQECWPLESHLDYPGCGTKRGCRKQCQAARAGLSDVLAPVTGKWGCSWESLQKCEFQPLSVPALLCRPGCHSQHSQSGKLRLNFFRLSVFLKTKIRKLFQLLFCKCSVCGTHTCWYLQNFCFPSSHTGLFQLVYGLIYGIWIIYGCAKIHLHKHDGVQNSQFSNST